MRTTNGHGRLDTFDYERKVWGGHDIGLHPWFLGATRLKYVLNALEQVSKGKVLEIGCGAGTFARALKRYRPDLEVFGCDLSKRSIELAKKIGGDISYSQADVYQLPFNKNAFDAVVSFDVWEHLEEPVVAFQEVFRVLKPKGIFHFYVPTEGENLSLYQLAQSWIYEAKQRFSGHVQQYTRKSLKRMLARAGFNVCKIQRSTFYIYQFVDLGYFLTLRLRGRNVGQSVEGYLASAPKGLSQKLLALVTRLFATVTYWENEWFKILPPGGVHITVVRK